MADNTLITSDPDKDHEADSGRISSATDTQDQPSGRNERKTLEHTTQLNALRKRTLSSRPEHFGIRPKNGLNAVRQAVLHCEQAADQADLCFSQRIVAAQGFPQQKTQSVSVASPQPNAKHRSLDSPIVANWTGTRASLLRSTITDTFFEGFYPSLIKLSDSLPSDIIKSLSSVCFLLLVDFVELMRCRIIVHR